uniref:Uncharacterized protein n=1 Tax=Eutreptiella gymnastica TaxID=73025 RepID=A0A7S1IS31_9EUGL
MRPNGATTEDDSSQDVEWVQRERKKKEAALQAMFSKVKQNLQALKEVQQEGWDYEPKTTTSATIPSPTRLARSSSVPGLPPPKPTVYMKQHQPDGNQQPILGSNAKIQGYPTSRERVYYRYHDGTVDDPQAFQAKFEDIVFPPSQNQVQPSGRDSLAAIKLNASMIGTFDTQLLDNEGEHDSSDSEPSDTKDEDSVHSAGDDEQGNHANGNVGSSGTSLEPTPSFITVEDPLQSWRAGLELNENPFVSLDQCYEGYRDNPHSQPSTRSQSIGHAQPHARTSESQSRRADSRSRASESRTASSWTSSQGEAPTAAYQKPYTSSGPCRTYDVSLTREGDEESGEAANLSTQPPSDWVSGRRSRSGYSQPGSQVEVSVFDSLYERSIKHHLVRNELAALAAKNKEAAEKLPPECTFKPKINSSWTYQQPAHDSGNVFDRLGDWDLKQRKIHSKWAKDKMAEKEIEGCTFTPKTEPLNMMGAVVPKVPVVRRLLRDAKKRKEKLKEKQKEEAKAQKRQTGSLQLDKEREERLVGRMQSDLVKREKKRKELIAKEARERRAAIIGRKTKGAETGDVVSRLFQDADRKRALYQLRKRAQQMFEEEHTFKPKISTSPRRTPGTQAAPYGESLWWHNAEEPAPLDSEEDPDPFPPEEYYSDGGDQGAVVESYGLQTSSYEEDDPEYS